MAIPAFQKPDKWTSRPLDPKCKTLTDYDPTVEDQIRCKVPAWSGDFRELLPELIAQGVRFDELARLTVHDIGQFVIRAVQGGSLSCGQIGTAKHTIISPLLTSDAAGGGESRWDAVDRLERKHWRILEDCAENQHIDRQSAGKESAITKRVEGAAPRALVNLRRYFKSLRDRGLLDAAQGVGTWITPKGVAAVNAHRDSQSLMPRIVS